MFSGPELAKLQKQFECECLADDDRESPKNHDQGLSAQNTFQRQVGDSLRPPEEWVTHSWIISQKILEDRTHYSHDPIKKNLLARFKKPQLKVGREIQSASEQRGTFCSAVRRHSEP